MTNEELRESLLSRGLEFTWTNDVREILCKEAYSVTYGARNLRRVIQKQLEDPISEMIIDSFEKPIETIVVSVVDGQISITSN